jgi:hypothetical protein
LTKSQNGYGERKEIEDVAKALLALKTDRKVLNERATDAGNASLAE